jgi:hypothetical protein
MPKRQPYKKRTKAEKEIDATQFLKYHVRQYSYREIGEMFGVSHTTVKKHIHELVDGWRDLNLDFIQKTIVTGIHALNEVESESWKAYQTSFNDSEKRRTETGGKDGGKDVEEFRSNNGDPRYLKLVVESQKAKAKLMQSLDLKKGDNEILERIAKALDIDVSDPTARS